LKVVTEWIGNQLSAPRAPAGAFEEEETAAPGIEENQALTGAVT
jgi:hypothetical protein